MTKYSNSFFQDEVSLIRRDGHTANDVIAIGNHVYVDTSDATVKVITPPEDAVGFYGNLVVGGGVRFTLDGVTNPTDVIGFNSIQGGSLIYIKPGNSIRVKATTAQAAGTSGINIQWVGSV